MAYSLCLLTSELFVSVKIPYAPGIKVSLKNDPTAQSLQIKIKIFKIIKVCAVLFLKYNFHFSLSIKSFYRTLLKFVSSLLQRNICRLNKKSTAKIAFTIYSSTIASLRSLLTNDQLEILNIQLIKDYYIQSFLVLTYISKKIF